MKKITKELIASFMTALLLLSCILTTTSVNKKNVPVQKQDTVILCYTEGDWEFS